VLNINKDTKADVPHRYKQALFDYKYYMKVNAFKAYKVIFFISRKPNDIPWSNDMLLGGSTDVIIH